MNKNKYRKTWFIVIFIIALVFLFLITSFVFQESKKSRAENEPQITNVKLNLKLAFQGIIRDRELEEKKLKVKLTTIDEAFVTKFPFDVDFIYNKADGVWNGLVNITGIDVSKKYSIFVKGPLHLQQRICDNNPDVLADSVDRYSCNTSNIILNSGENNLDFSRVVLRAGDLHIQDGVANSEDIAKVRQNLGKKDVDLLTIADINLDGIIDTQDYSLVIDGLLVQTDDEIPATVSPTPTLTPTISITPSAIATPTSSVSPSPTGSITPSPTSSPQGIWSTPAVLGKGGRFSWVVVNNSGSSHLAWGDPASKTIWYATCQRSISSCSKTQINTDLDSYYPSLSFDTSTNSHVVWESRVPTAATYAVYYSKRTGDTWSEPVKISSEPYAEVPSIALSQDNTIHVTYQSTDGGTVSIYHTSTTDGTSWTTPFRIGHGYHPKIRSSNSKMHVAWMSGSEPHSVYLRTLQDGNWSSELTVSNGNKDQVPDIAVDNQGNVHMVWLKDKVSSYVKIQGTNMTDLKDNIGGSFEYSYWPKIALDQSNNPYIVFQGKRVGDGKWGIYRIKKNGQTWGDVETLTQTEVNQQSPSISLNQSNGTIVFTNGNDVLVSFLQ